MKRLITILFILVSALAYGQGQPPGYTYIAQRYDWLAGKFRALHIPAGTDTVLQAGQYIGAGAILIDTSGSSQGVWYRMNNRWNKIGDNSNTIYNADDSLSSNRTVYVNGISFPTRSLVFSQNASNNNTTAQPMTITISENRFRLSKTLQVPGAIPDDFAPFQSVGRLLGSGTVNFSGASTRYRPLTLNLVGGFTNSATATFNNGGNGGPTTLINAEWQTDRTAPQTITGWIGVYRSSLQFTGNAQPLTIENFADYIAGQVMHGGRGTLTNRYQFYALSGKIDSVANSYAFYNAGSLDSNYFAGPIRALNLPDSDSTSAKPVGRLSNGVLVDLPYWPGAGSGSPSLTATQIGFGNGSNLLSGSSDLTFTSVSTERLINIGGDGVVNTPSRLSLRRNSSNDWVRFEDDGSWFVNGVPGNDGQALVSKSFGASPEWTTVVPTVASVSTTSTLPSPTIGGLTIKADCTSGAITLTFPAAASYRGYIYRIKKMDASANAFNITTLEGALAITTQYAGYVVQSDGTNWLIIGVF